MSRDSRYAATEDLLAKIDDVVSGHEQQRSPEPAIVLDDDLPEFLRYRSTERDLDGNRRAYRSTDLVLRDELRAAYRRPALGTWTVVAPEPGNEYVDHVSGRVYRGTEDGRWEPVHDVAEIVDRHRQADQIDSFAIAFAGLSRRPLRIEADGTFSGYVSPGLFPPIESPIRPAPFLAPGLALVAFGAAFTAFSDGLRAFLATFLAAERDVPSVPVPRKPSDRRYVRRRR